MNDFGLRILFFSNLAKEQITATNIAKNSNIPNYLIVKFSQ